MTWQPLAGWQIDTPDGPGAHNRLQQSPQPSHSMPSTFEQYDGPFGGSAQVPMVCPSAIEQAAVQQSASLAHVSPGCTQKDEPSLQCCVSSHRPEQQSPFFAHSLPPVLQLSLSAVHVLSAPHTPPQHSALALQALPSEMHAASEQAPAAQRSEQHSVATLHALPAGVQVFGTEMQPVCESHSPEQQSAPLLQLSDTAWQSPPGLLVLAPVPFPPDPVSPDPFPALAMAPVPASAEAPEPAAPGPLEDVELPQPTQISAEAISSAPRTRLGRVMA